MLELLQLRRRARVGLVISSSSNEIGERSKGVQLNDEGMHMPVFTFERISPPVRRGPIAPIVKKQRGVIVQILSRFVEARMKRTLREKGGIARRQRRPPD